MSALVTVFLLGCGGRDNSISDSSIVEELTGRLVQENARHYAFGCIDPDGSLLAAGYAPDAVARDAGIEHAADSWAAETGGLVLGGENGQRYLVIHDPASDATNAQEFQEREVATSGGKLTCLVPK